MQVKNRTNWILLSALLLALAASAQDDTDIDDEFVGPPAPPAPGLAGEDELAAEAAPEPALPEPEDRAVPEGLQTFRPSEEISADRSVAFPNDI